METIVKYWPIGLALFFIYKILKAFMVFKMESGTIEVGPKEACVLKNIWSGELRALYTKTHSFNPWMEKIHKRVSLKNEPSGPYMAKPTSADGLTVELEYSISNFMVADPVMAVNEIEFENRLKTIKDERIIPFLQDTMEGIVYDDLFPTDENGDKLLSKEVKKNVIKKINNLLETEVNAKLVQEVKAEWGIHATIQINKSNLPEKYMEVIEESVTSEHEGKKIRAKAEASGVSPTVIAIGDIFSDVLKVWKGGSK